MHRSFLRPRRHFLLNFFHCKSPNMKNSKILLNIQDVNLCFRRDSKRCVTRFTLSSEESANLVVVNVTWLIIVTRENFKLSASVQQQNVRRWRRCCTYQTSLVYNTKWFFSHFQILKYRDNAHICCCCFFDRGEVCQTKVYWKQAKLHELMHQSTR